MININSILAGLTPVAGAAKPLPPFGDDSAHFAPAVQEKDTFSQGETWLNRGHLSEPSQKEGNGIFTQVERAYEGQPYLAISAVPLKSDQSSENNSEEIKLVDASKNQPDDVAQSETDDVSEGQEQTEASPIGPVAPDGTPLSGADKQLLAQLQEADMKVKAHEAAHLAAAGGYATGGASYQYQQGPDGKKYAIGGEVPIDMGKETSPEQTIAKMRIVRRAALAPADPSPQDQSVAARATLNIAEASQELRVEAVPENSLKDAAANYGNTAGNAGSSKSTEGAGASVHVDFQGGGSGNESASFLGKAYKMSSPVSVAPQSPPALNLFV